jgi:putative ABC transport system substrate-binding protein
MATGEEAKERLIAGMQKAGIDPGAVEFLMQQPTADSISIANGIRKLTAYNVGILVTVGGSAAREAIKLGVKVPILFIGSYDPVDQGLVKDLKAPGKNVTGVSMKSSLVLLLDSIQETAAPKSIAVLVNPDNADGASQLKEMQTLCAARGIAVTVVDSARNGSEAILERLGSGQFVYLASGSLSESFGPQELARLARPLVTQMPEFPGSGCLFSLAPPMEAVLDEGGALLARLVKGEKPSGIPVSAVRRIEFTVNMAEAGRSGLKIPFPVVSRATRVIK